MAQPAIQKNETPRSGKSRNPQEVARVLEGLRVDCNVVAPPGLAGVRLPNGFSVVWGEVDVDHRSVRDGGDVYNVQGGYTLTATTLDRLAAAFGVAWDSARSGRLDGGEHPYLCLYLAVGSFMGPDGMPVPLSGTNKTDLRDGSAQTEGFRDAKGDLNTKTLRQQRQHILSISESKARARAFRKAIGLRAMTQKDVSRPWVVFRIQLTGETDDPRTQQMFEMMIFKSALGARQALYGPPAALPTGQAHQMPQLPPVAPVPQLLEHDEDGEVIDEDYEPPPPVEREPAQASRQAAPPKRDSQPRSVGGGVWPWAPKKDGDPEKGAPLASVDSAALERLVTYYEKNPGDERWAAKNLALADEARAIIASRSGGGVGDGYDGRGDDPDNY